MENHSPEAREQTELQEYLVSGGRIKKDCWLFPMHLRYNPVNELFELVDSTHTYNGKRGFSVLSAYGALDEVPYAGNWVKCDDKGVELK